MSGRTKAKRLVRRLSKQLLRFALDTEGDLLELSLQILMQTGFLGGGKGSGKTTALKKLFEAAHAAGAQCGAIATLGKWWSLRISKSGKRKGLVDVFIFGGKYGDVAISRDSGRAVARTVVSKRIHFVLDVETMKKADRIVFLADFLEELSLLKKNEEQPPSLVLFIDEMQNVAAQKSRGADSERLKEAAADLARECRNYGMGLWASAQRVANVDKDYIALVDALIAMRTTWSGDRKVYKDWIDEKGGGDDDDYGWIKKLRRLEKGQGYLHLPEQNIFQRVQMLMIDTFDATKTASIGERVTQVGRLSKLDVKRLGAELAGVVAESEANDPKLLRAKVSELERQLAQRKREDDHANALVKKAASLSALKPVKPDLRTEKRIAKQARIAGVLANKVEALISKLQRAGFDFKEGVSKLKSQVIKPGYAIGVSKDSATPVRVIPALPGSSKFKPEVVQTGSKKLAFIAKHGTSPEEPNEVKLGSGERVVMGMIAQYPNGATGEQITVVTGYKRSTRNTYLQRLSQAGYVRCSGERHLPTAEGIAWLGGDYKPLPSGDELRQHWLTKLPSGESKLLGELLNAYPSTIARERLGEVTGFKRSTYNTYLQRLSARQLIVDGPSGDPKASPHLFGDAA